MPFSKFSKRTSKRGKNSTARSSKSKPVLSQISGNQGSKVPHEPQALGCGSQCEEVPRDHADAHRKRASDTFDMISQYMDNDQSSDAEEYYSDSSFNLATGSIASTLLDQENDGPAEVPRDLQLFQAEESIKFAAIARRNQGLAAITNVFSSLHDCQESKSASTAGRKKGRMYSKSTVASRSRSKGRLATYGKSPARRDDNRPISAHESHLSQVESSKMPDPGTHMAANSPGEPVESREESFPEHGGTTDATTQQTNDQPDVQTTDDVSDESPASEETRDESTDDTSADERMVTDWYMVVSATRQWASSNTTPLVRFHGAFRNLKYANAKLLDTIKTKHAYSQYKNGRYKIEDVKGCFRVEYMKGACHDVFWVGTADVSELTGKPEGLEFSRPDIEIQRTMVDACIRRDERDPCYFNGGTWEEVSRTW